MKPEETQETKEVQEAQNEVPNKKKRDCSMDEYGFAPRPDSHFWNDPEFIPKSDPRYDEPPVIPLPY